VSPETLIPRPETELLVDLAIDAIDRRVRAPHSGRSSLVGESVAAPGRVRVLDAGTGSGAIAVTVLADRPGVVAVGTDTSAESLLVARANAVTHGVADRARFVACDLASAVSGTFSVVAANLPYVPTAEMATLEPEVTRYEPRPALDGGPDGMDLVRRLLRSMRDILEPGGLAVLEIGEGQAGSLSTFVRDRLPGFGLSTSLDLAGIERFLIVEREKA
jgi:release factor glutamine methyltransferase